MQAKLVHEDAGQKTYVLVLDEGEEVIDQLTRFAEESGVRAAQISAIGAFSSARLGYFAWDEKDYKPIAVDEQVEVASLNGDIAEGPDGRPALHVHAVLGRSDGTALAGHLLRGYVRPTLEVILTESPSHLVKRHDPKTGLALIRPHAS